MRGITVCMQRNNQFCSILIDSFILLFCFVFVFSLQKTFIMLFLGVKSLVVQRPSTLEVPSVIHEESSSKYDLFCLKLQLMLWSITDVTFNNFFACISNFVLYPLCYFCFSFVWMLLVILQTCNWVFAFSNDCNSSYFQKYHISSHKPVSQSVKNDNKKE